MGAAGPQGRAAVFGIRDETCSLLPGAVRGLPPCGITPGGHAGDRISFFAVLHDHYAVKSDVQRRKMLTFFVAAAGYAGLPISPDIRPTMARPGPRKAKRRRRTKATASRPAKAAARTPETHADPGAQDANGSPAERRDISFGDAGSVSIDVNVHWLDLPDEKFTELRKLIKDIEALGDSGS